MLDLNLVAPIQKKNLREKIYTSVLQGTHTMGKECWKKKWRKVEKSEKKVGSNII